MSQTWQGWDGGAGWHNTFCSGHLEPLNPGHQSKDRLQSWPPCGEVWSSSFREWKAPSSPSQWSCSLCSAVSPSLLGEKEEKEKEREREQEEKRKGEEEKAGRRQEREKGGKWRVREGEKEMGKGGKRGEKEEERERGRQKGEKECEPNAWHSKEAAFKSFGWDADLQNLWTHNSLAYKACWRHQCAQKGLAE